MSIRFDSPRRMKDPINARVHRQSILVDGAKTRKSNPVFLTAGGRAFCSRGPFPAIKVAAQFLWPQFQGALSRLRRPATPCPPGSPWLRKSSHRLPTVYSSLEYQVCRKNGNNLLHFRTFEASSAYLVCESCGWQSVIRTTCHSIGGIRKLIPPADWQR